MEITKNKLQHLYDQAAMGASEEIRKKFWGLVEKSETCWLFRGEIKLGYGSFQLWSRSYRAHRLALLWHEGVPRSQGMMACHTCPNKTCVSPFHLYFGTAQQNMDDKVRDGTNLIGEKHPMAIITAKTAAAVKEMAKNPGMSSGSIAARLNITKAIVKNILRGSCWKDGTAPLKRGLAGIRKHYGSKGHPNSKLKEADVLFIRRQLAAGVQGRVLAKEYNVSTGMISAIRVRRTWAQLPNEQGGESVKRKIPKRLTTKDIALIKKALKKNTHGLSASLARQFGVAPTTICAIKKGYTYTDIYPAQ